jgi:ADP-ribose pyrophosphatase
LTRRLIVSEKIFSGTIFNVDRDRIQEPDGSQIVREVVRHPGGAGGLPLFEDGTVALVRQYRHPAGRDLLEIPAGRMEPGETPELCAAREIEQEIGYRPGRIEKIAEFFSTPGFCEERLFVYLATRLLPAQQNLDHDEFVEVVRIPLADAILMANRGDIEDSKTLVALLMADRMIKTS